MAAEFRSRIGVAALALKHQLTVYDTAYLELAIRSKLPIATNRIVP
ncbi:MAG: hypothetical protein M3Z23_15355 [Acidobacteriota bacterium]|nr:hypothetical protein [Acidobacteriota bacterium]